MWRPSEGVFESNYSVMLKGLYGRTADRVGRFELADGGTLFLDENREYPAQPAGEIIAGT